MSICRRYSKFPKQRVEEQVIERQVALMSLRRGLGKLTCRVRGMLQDTR
jgi:hypothetical protein